MMSHLFPLLVCLALLAGACAPVTEAPLTVSPAVDQEWQAKLDEYLTRLRDLGFHGSVLVAHRGAIVLSKGYGFLDTKGTEPITPDTIFAIGSNTKSFTAAAILKLQDQGVLNVNDPIRRFLPEAPADKADITLHQLLTHSAGLDHSGAFHGDFENVSREAAVERILGTELLFPPGQESSYSDYGFILLAAIIELASGQTYQDYLRTELFEPAGMTHTGWWGNDPALQGQPVVRLPGPFWAIMGAGGMVSSVTDLYRWHVALQEGKILSERSLEAYSSVQFRLDERGGEGYGWVVLDEPGRRVRASAGGTPQLGHNNVIRWQMDEDILLIASSSHDAWKAEDIVPNLTSIVLDRPYQLPPKKAAVDPALLDRYAGRYQITDGNVIVVTRKEDGLFMTGEGQEAFDMLFKAEPGIDVQAAQAAVVNYLNSGADRQLDQWKNRTSNRLGEFREFNVIGTASPTGSGEPWTYVSFEFERGTALTRWIVSPAGALQAALLETEPPYMRFVPQSEDQFVPFSLSSQPVIQEILFSVTGAGDVGMTISIPTGTLNAPKLNSSS